MIDGAVHLVVAAIVVHTLHATMVGRAKTARSAGAPVGTAGLLACVRCTRQAIVARPCRVDTLAEGVAIIQQRAEKTVIAVVVRDALRRFGLGHTFAAVADISVSAVGVNDALRRFGFGHAFMAVVADIPVVASDIAHALHATVSGRAKTA